MKTVILGGGLSGITLALLLHEKSVEVTVLEREPMNDVIKTLIALEKGELAPPQNFREWIVHIPTEQISLNWVEGRIPR